MSARLKPLMTLTYVFISKASDMPMTNKQHFQSYLTILFNIILFTANSVDIQQHWNLVKCCKESE